MKKEELKNLSQEELIKKIEELQARQGKNRKGEVLELIEKGFDSATAISEEMGITTKNVASILTALRKDGHHILTMKVAGQNILKMLTNDEAKKLGLA